MKHGLFDLLSEIEKSAAPVDSLIKGMKRLGAIRASAKKGLSSMHTSFYAETPKQLSLSTGRPISDLPPTNIGGKIFRPAGEGGASQAFRTKLDNMYKNYPPPEGEEYLKPHTLSTLKNLSGPGHRAFNAVTGIHEGFERGVKPNEIFPIHTHASPKVLLNEHNLLSKMTGPGSDEARTIYRDIRDNDFEYGFIRDNMRKTYGDRALQYMEEGSRIPSAMKRDLLKRFNALHKWNIEPEINRFKNKLAGKSHPQHEEFLDTHFSISPQWKTFKSKLRSKSFVETVKQDIRSDEKLKRYSEANGKHIRARGVPTFSVPSQSNNRNYTVKFHPDDQRFTCSCGDWIHARSHQVRKSSQDCKHITMVRSQLQEKGTDLSELTKRAALGIAAVNLLTK